MAKLHHVETKPHHVGVQGLQFGAALACVICAEHLSETTESVRTASTINTTNT
jgi:hypothetical protein